MISNYIKNINMELTKFKYLITNMWLRSETCYHERKFITVETKNGITGNLSKMFSNCFIFHNQMEPSK